MTGAVSGLIGGGPPSAPDVHVFQPAYTQQADQNYWNTINAMQGNNPFTQQQPQYAGVRDSTVNNPYAFGAQSGANAGGTAATNAGNQSINSAGQIAGTIPTTLNAGQQVLNTAFDPQQELYKRTLQQLQDQVRTGQAARGITQSGYGANLEDQALSNFNIDWQNNQLGRQTTGLTAYNGATSAAGGAANTASNLGTAGSEQLYTGGKMPYTQYNSNEGSILDALNAYSASQSGANSQNQTVASDLLQYLGLGASQSNTQAQLNMSNYKNQLAAYQSGQDQLSSLFGGGLDTLSSGFTGGGSGGGFDPASAAATALSFFI